MAAVIIGRLWRMSLQSCMLILVILVVRLLLKKHQKIYSYGLWLLVGIRLLCPFMISSPFSLQPDLSDSGSGLNSVLTNQNPGFAKSAGHTENPGTSPVALQNLGSPDTVLGTDGYADTPRSNPEEAFPMPDRMGLDHQPGILFRLLGMVYLAGVIFLILHFFIQYLQIRHNIARAVFDCGNVWLCETIQSPFVVGIYKPRILLPYGLGEPGKSYILRHEETHIRHHDPLVRFAGLVCVCLHWWNPLVWMAVRRMEQDMEMFCDECVLRHSDLKERKAYARTLLSCARQQSGLAAGPAFGESNTERRVEHIMKQRKNSFFVLCCVILLTVFCCGAFITIPRAAEHSESPQEAPVYFRDYAINDGIVYTSYPNDSQSCAILPVNTDFCAIYRKELYYVAESVGGNTGEVEDGRLTVYRCELDGTNKRKVLELEDVSWIGDMVLRDGFLYCDYARTGDDVMTIAKTNISGTGLAEYQLPAELSGVLGFETDCVYSRLTDGRETAFYEYSLDTGEQKELYRCSGCFLESFSARENKIFLLLSDDETCTLLAVDKKGNITNYGTYGNSTGWLLAGDTVYCGIGNVLYRLDETEHSLIPLEYMLPENMEAVLVRPIQEDDDCLYFIVDGQMPGGESSNTFLMQYNLESGETTLLWAYYEP